LLQNKISSNSLLLIIKSFPLSSFEVLHLNCNGLTLRPIESLPTSATCKTMEHKDKYWLCHFSPSINLHSVCLVLVMRVWWHIKTIVFSRLLCNLMMLWRSAEFNIHVRDKREKIAIYIAIYSLTTVCTHCMPMIIQTSSIKSKLLFPQLYYSISQLYLNSTFTWYTRDTRSSQKIHTLQTLQTVPLNSGQ